MSFYDIMKKASDDVNMEFNEAKYDKFIKYMRLVQEWNEKINLTAITEDDEFIKKHFIDCIKAFKSEEIKNANTLIDVGTGAGFPGVPIAIMRDDLEVTLLDSLNKRINFLNEVIKSLDLKDIKTIHSRAEDAAHMKEYREKYDVSISRAVAQLNVLVEYLLPFVKVGGRCICMKGSNAEEEIKNAKNAIKELGGEIEEVKKFNLPGTDMERNIIVIKKINNCKNKYPRKAGTPLKEPII